MKGRAGLLLTLAAISLGGCYFAHRDAEDPPLLLEEPKKGAQEEASEGMADNSPCHVCHINYEDEPLALWHAKAGVGCEKCHGASEAHTNDEDNITPPDKMYARDVVNKMCMDCHKKVELAKKQEDHKDVLPAPASARKVCTDCHGKHRLERRNVLWDKRTGKLLPDDQQPK